MKVYFPIIAYGGVCRAEFSIATSSLFCQSLTQRKDISFHSDGIFFESLISRGRNAAAAAALHCEADYLLFIDSDIRFDPADVFKLLDADKDVICGAYAKKYINDRKLNYLARNKPEVFETSEWRKLCSDFSSEIDPSKSKNNLTEVDYAATGFMLIKTSALKTIASQKPDIKYKNDIDGYISFGDNFYNFFPAEVNPKTLKYESEDYGFCKLWRSVGGKIFLDESIHLHHIGNFAYEGHLDSQLKTYNHG